MEIKGTRGYLSPAEIAATGLPNPVLLTTIDTADLLGRLDERRQGLEAKQAADDDELTLSERASIASEQCNLSSDRRVTEELVGQIVAHEVALFLLSDS